MKINLNNILLPCLLAVLLAGCKSLDYKQIRTGAMQGNIKDIGLMQAAYLKVTPASRLTYMLDLSVLQSKYPVQFATALAEQKPQTQQAVGYLLQGEKDHRSLVEKVLRTTGSNNSP